VSDTDFDASNHIEDGGSRRGAHSDGGRNELERQNGVDVIR